MREVAEIVAVDRVVEDGGHPVEQPQVRGAVPGLREVILVEQVPVPEVWQQQDAPAMPGLAVGTNEEGRRPERRWIARPIALRFARVRACCKDSGALGFSFVAGTMGMTWGNARSSS